MRLVSSLILWISFGSVQGLAADLTFHIPLVAELRRYESYFLSPQAIGIALARSGGFPVGSLHIEPTDPHTLRFKRIPPTPIGGATLTFVGKKANELTYHGTVDWAFLVSMPLRFSVVVSLEPQGARVKIQGGLANLLPNGFSDRLAHSLERLASIERQLALVRFLREADSYRAENGKMDGALRWIFRQREAPQLAPPPPPPTLQREFPWTLALCLWGLGWGTVLVYLRKADGFSAWANQLRRELKL